MVHYEHLRKQVKKAISSFRVLQKVSVHGVYKFLPGFLLEILQLFVDLWCQFKVELVNILQNVMGTNHFGNFDELVIIVCTLEEWFPLENHPSQHASRTPDVELIVVMGHADEKFWALEESASYPAVETLLGCVKVGKAPVSDSNLAGFMVYQNVVWFDVSVDNAP